MKSFDTLFCRFLLAAILLMSGLSVQAQGLSKDAWHYGEVNLFSGETLKGRIKYDLDKNNILLSHNGLMKSLGPQKVESFEFFDEVLQVQRFFFALPYSKTGTYEAPVFFELLGEGKITLLSREAIVTHYVPSTMMAYRQVSTPVYVVVDSFYFLDSKEKVSHFTSKKDELLALMPDQHEAVDHFIRSNRLNLESRQDLLRILDYYNSLYKGIGKN